MTTSQQNEFIQSLEGELTPQDAAKLLSMADGDTPAPSEETVSEPAASTSSVEVTPKSEGGQEATPPASEVEPDPANTVILAKDGKHTIDYNKLVEARNGEKNAKAEADSLRQQLAVLQAEAQVRATAGQAPTAIDNAAAAAQAAIDEGIDPAIFGDFSEEALTKGIQQVVEQKVVAQVEARVKQTLEPIQQKHAVDATTAHYAAIYGKHPDADSIVESKELGDWIGSQPSFVRDAYVNVLSNGSTEQVIEMLDRFKEATGTTQVEPKPDAANAAEAAKAAAKAAIANTKTAVPSSLTDFPAGKPGVAASDFEVAAEMDAHKLLENMSGWSQDKINDFLDRRL